MLYYYNTIALRCVKKYRNTTQPTHSVPLEYNLKWVFAVVTLEDLLLIINQGFIDCKKSETMPKSKFKVEKLCHDIYFKFGQYYRYYITMYDFNHIIQISIPIWSWISKRKLGNVTFSLFF